MDVKLRRKDGFTLAELLIVVAIITVLVAVSIPIFSAQLDKARASTDAANVRAAKAAAVTDYLTNGTTTESVIYYYDADSGKITTDATTAEEFSKYGKSTKDIDLDKASGIPKDQIVAITVSDSATTAAWVMGSGSSSETGTVAALSAKSKTNWDRIIASGASTSPGRNIPPGTLVSDGGKLYLVYGNQNYYTTEGKSSMADLMKDYPSCIEEITNSTPIISQSTIDSGGLANTTINGGSIALYDNKYYCAKETISYNEWENNRRPTTDSRWAEIE